jgi:hypothetical protein
VWTVDGGNLVVLHTFKVLCLLCVEMLKQRLN